MFSQIGIMTFALAGGIFSAYSGLSPLLPAMLIISVIFGKRKIFNLALIIMFIAGFMLFSAYKGREHKPGLYMMDVTVSRTMGAGYIVNEDNSYCMRCNNDLFEGDRVYGTFMIKPLGDRDFDHYLKRINVNNYIVPVGIDSVAPGSGIPRIRVNIINRIRRNVTDHDASALSSAIITGYRNDMSRILRDRFNRTGTAHLLAISGLHTGIIFMLINFILFFIPISKRLKLITAVIMLILFAVLTYGNIPVVRAVIFIAVYALSRLMHRKIKEGAILMAAAAIIMIINPFAVISLSFWLSFSAVYIIVQMYRRTGNIIITLLLLPALMIPLTGIAFGRFHILSSTVSLWLIPLFFIYIPASIISAIAYLPAIDNMLAFLFAIISRTVYIADILPLHINLDMDICFACILGIALIMMMNKKYHFMLGCSACLLVYTLL